MTVRSLEKADGAPEFGAQVPEARDEAADMDEALWAQSPQLKCGEET